MMGFLEAYKRLEKLCGEILNDERKISAYIDEMKNIPQGGYLVQGWDDDFKKLKHYRWIRNQIVHNPDCTEENMCNSSDTQWILAFYTRIMNRTDPLTLYRKVKQSQQKPLTYHAKQQYPQQQHVSNHDTAKNEMGCLMAMVIAAVVTMVLLCLLRFTILR